MMQLKSGIEISEISPSFFLNGFVVNFLLEAILTLFVEKNIIWLLEQALTSIQVFFSKRLREMLTDTEQFSNLEKETRNVYQIWYSESK